jgi:hypothetical protein
MEIERAVRGVLLRRVFERLKLLVRLRKQLLRRWRLGRARIENLVHGVRWEPFHAHD